MKQLRVSMLQWAACKGRMRIAKLLLELHEADPNGRNSDEGNTPLHLATAWKQVDMVDLLLDRPGIDLNCQNTIGETPLMLAIKYGCTQIIERFLLGPEENDCRPISRLRAAWRRLSGAEQPVNPRAPAIDATIRREDGKTALHVAVTRASKETIDLLLRRVDVSPNVLDKGNSSPLHWAVAARRPVVVRALLAHREINPNTFTRYKLTPLFVAVQMRHLQIIRLLLAHPRTDVNCRCEREGITPLMYAARVKRAAVLSALLSSGRVDKDAQDHKGVTALMYATSKGCRIIVELLLESPTPDVNLARKDGITPLMIAASEGNLDIAALLLDHGADAEQHACGRTPLFNAAFYGQENMVRLLLGYVDENANRADEKGRTPVFAAAANGHDRIVDMLLRHLSGDLQRADEKGSTPLIEAARNGHERVVRLLLSHGDVSPNHADYHGETALAAAATKGHENIVRLLLDGRAEFAHTTRSSRRLWRDINKKGYHGISRLLRDQIKTEGDDSLG